MPLVASKSTFRCTDWRVSPMFLAICATGSGVGDTDKAASTCHQAVVRPIGDARSFPAEINVPFSRKTATTKASTTLSSWSDSTAMTEY
jgi:hypothetical protein